MFRFARRLSQPHIGSSIQRNIRAGVGGPVNADALIRDSDATPEVGPCVGSLGLWAPEKVR